jgi:CBS domain containing-hemolysin-like protein
MSDPDPSDPAPSGRLRKMLGFGRKDRNAELATEPGIGEPATSPHEMRLRIEEFEQMRVVDVMVARAEVKAVEVGMEFPELLKYFAEVTHSRLPVFRESLDDPIGFVHIKDVVKELATGGETAKQPLERLHREVLYVPPSMKLTDLLVKMQSTHIHLALVVDEYGGTDGLVSLEDLVEEIVGDIEDEHDDEEPMFVRRSQRVWTWIVTSTRLAASCSRWLAKCPSAARSFGTHQGSKSKSWTPMRGAFVAFACEHRRLAPRRNPRSKA